MADYDVVIVGGGAAGLSAALMLARARRKVVVIDSEAPRNRPAAHMHGYLSRDGFPPAELLAAGRAEVRGYGGEIVVGAVTELDSHGWEGCSALLGDGTCLKGRRVIVATGLCDKLPDIAGLGERWGRDVLHCPYCHGHEVADRPLGVLGRSRGSVHYAQVVRQWSDDVMFFVPEGTLSQAERSQLAARDVAVVEDRVTHIVVQDDRLRGVALADGRVFEREAVFLRPHLVPNNDLLMKVGCEVDDHGWVVSDRSGRTSVPALWVAGNVVNPRAQVINAASEGSRAGMAVNADLVDEEVRAAVRAHRGRGESATG